MPEGPEVLMMKNHIKSIIGQILVSNNFDKRINNESVKDIVTYGKLLQIVFTNNIVLKFQFGLYGKLTKDHDEEHEEYIVYTFEFEKDVIYYINKAPSIGSKVSISNCLEEEKVPDVMKSKIDIDYLYNKSIKSKKTLASFLIDKNVMVGIGNYLRSDIMYVSKLNPMIKVNELDRNDIKTLTNSIYRIVNDSLKNGGSIKYGGKYKYKIYGSANKVKIGNQYVYY
jgi:endonuclease-8